MCRLKRTKLDANRDSIEAAQNNRFALRAFNEFHFYIDQAKKKTAKIPLKLLNELLVTMQKGCLCALCGAIPTPIMNILKYFGDEMKSDMVKDN